MITSQHRRTALTDDRRLRRRREEDRLVAHGPTIDDVTERSRLFRGRDVTTSLLSGGYMNSAYVVQAGDARYVVRIPAVASGLLVSRPSERATQHRGGRCIGRLAPGR